jgi:hypothetical protein
MEFTNTRLALRHRNGSESRSGHSLTSKPGSNGMPTLRNRSTNLLA